MLWLALGVAYLTCACHGKRSQQEWRNPGALADPRSLTKLQQAQSSRPIGAFHPARTLADFLFTMSPAAGWQLLGCQSLGVTYPVSNPAVSRSAVEMQKRIMKPKRPLREKYPGFVDKAPLFTQGNYDPEYDDDIVLIQRELLNLRFRKACRQPVKSHEFSQLRKIVARLKTAKRLEQLKAAGVDITVGKKSRLKRQKMKAKQREKDEGIARQVERWESQKRQILAQERRRAKKEQMLEERLNRFRGDDLRYEDQAREAIQQGSRDLGARGVSDLSIIPHEPSEHASSDEGTSVDIAAPELNAPSAPPSLADLAAPLPVDRDPAVSSSVGLGPAAGTAPALPADEDPTSSGEDLGPATDTAARVLTAREEEPGLLPTADWKMTEIRAFVKERGLDVKTAGPGHTKKTVLEDIRAALEAQG